MKNQIFIDSFNNLTKKKADLYRREPEQKLYDEHQIGFATYLEMARTRKETERNFYKNNIFYQNFDDGLITYEEFVEQSKKQELVLMDCHQ